MKIFIISTIIEIIFVILCSILIKNTNKILIINDNFNKSLDRVYVFIILFTINIVGIIASFICQVISFLLMIL